MLYKFREWLQNFQDVPGFLGAHLNMPITPRQVHQGRLKGGNALGLEGAANRTLGGELERCNPLSVSNLTYICLVLFFGITFEDPQYKEHILPEHDRFVQSMIELARERGVLYPYMYAPSYLTPNPAYWLYPPYHTYPGPVPDSYYMMHGTWQKFANIRLSAQHAHIL